jgi:hypothetical protein
VGLTRRQCSYGSGELSRQNGGNYRGEYQRNRGNQVYGALLLSREILISKEQGAALLSFELAVYFNFFLTAGPESEIGFPSTCRL